MLKLPPEFVKIISVFSPNFSKKIFEHAGQLLLGTVLTQGKRTVCSVLRSLGAEKERNWSKYHRVLSRAKWSALSCSKALLLLLLKTFISGDTLVFGIDETIERRWGTKIKAKGLYRDAVRSSKSFFVKCTGLRWVCVMLLSPIGWANRIWALPFLSVLAPSERYHEQLGKPHKTLSDWARQIAYLLHRWLPDFELIVLGDGSYAVMETLAAAPPNLTWIVRFRMDARLHDPPPPYQGMGRPPIKGERQTPLKQRLTDKRTVWDKAVFSKWYDEENKEVLVASGTALWYRAGKPAVPLRWILVKDPDGKFEPFVLACTNLELVAEQIIAYYLQRWQVEVTFEQLREHLGVETQRQWSDRSIARTTPVLMALFSIVTLWAERLEQSQKLTVFQTAWYNKPFPTFSDAIASVRFRTWHFQLNSQSSENKESELSRIKFINHLAFMAARAA